MTWKPDLDRMTDSEGVTHFASGAQAVKTLCGSNDYMHPPVGLIDCRACLAILRHVYSRRRPEEMEP